MTRCARSGSSPLRQVITPGDVGGEYATVDSARSPVFHPACGGRSFLHLLDPVALEHAFTRHTAHQA
jgi:hypothetical protein